MPATGTKVKYMLIIKHSVTGGLLDSGPPASLGERHSLHPSSGLLGIWGQELVIREV